MKIKIIGVVALIAAAVASKAQTIDQTVAESYSNEKIVLEKKPSVVSIPFDISIVDLQNIINKQLPELIYDDNDFENNNNDDLKTKVWRKGNLEFARVVENSFEYKVPLKVWAQKRVSALGMTQTPATTFEIELSFISKFTIGSDYSVQTVTNPNGYNWLTKPVIKVGFVEIPLTSIIGKVIDNNHAGFARQIDESIKSSISLKPYVTQAWVSAQKPILASEEYNTWVKISPTEVYLTPFKSTGKSIVSTVGFKVIVETLVGTPTQTEAVSTTIPSLKYVESIPNTFEINLFNLVSYDEATRISKKMFVGQKYDFKKGKYKVELTDLLIYGNGENLVFKIDTKGSFNGTVYVKGIPQYDPVRRQVVLTKTELDIKTKNFLHKSAAWLLEGTLERKIEKEFGLPVDELIEYGKASVLQNVNRELSKGVKMTGSVLSVEPTHVKISENGIVAFVNAKAKVEIIVNGMY